MTMNLKIKNYLSFGGGVNSVAMMLLLMDEGVEFGPGKDCEAVYVWMPDWPETHEYLMMLESNGLLITILTGCKTSGPVKYGNLYDFSWSRSMFPQRRPRWCTSDFKVKTIHNYVSKPCQMLIGIDWDESHRAKISSVNGIDNRYPLIEREISRENCLEIIKRHGLPIPIKSGCYICPFQKVSQLRQLRRLHPDYWCRLVELEKRNVNRANKKDSSNFYSWGKPVADVVNEPDTYLFDDMAYPPCQCGL